MRSLLAWNFVYPTVQWFGNPFSTGSSASSDLPRTLSPLSGADISANPGFDFFAMPVPQAGSSKIVFTSNRDGNAEIYSMNVDGSSLTRLTTNAFNDDHPRWSPNGTKILFQSDRDNPETGNYVVYVMNANGTSQTRLTYDAADDSAAEWSSDGTKIVFQSLRNGQYYQVYVMNADGTNQVNTSGGFAADYQPSWSPDGVKIAFASERDQAGRPSVYVMNANGSNQTKLTFSSAPFRDDQPAWSRDATRIAFVSTRDSVVVTWQETDDDGAILNRSRVRTNKEVYLMNADGSNQARLTNTLENDDSPYWSPDGSQIIFRSERERASYDPTQQLWIMSASGTNQALLAGNGFGDYSPSWKTSTNQAPVASAGGPYSGLSGAPIQFNGGGSADPDGTIASYQWNFSDGGSGAGITPTHSYATAGNYTVTLTVTDNDGATASATATATVANRPPVANAGGPYSSTTGTAIQFNGGGSNDPDGTITGHSWNFGDGGSGTGATPLHTYTTAGNYTVTLTVTDNNGAQASATAPATIANRPPVANAGGPYSSTTGTAIQFNGSGSSDPDGTITSHQWNFGDNTSGAGITPTHTYTTAGNYTVTLIVTDNNGATASANSTATIGNQPPVANAGGPYSGAAGTAIQFNGGGSNDPDGTVTGYSWNFGDSGNGTGATPLHTYATAGNYTVTLTVTDNNGAQASATATATVANGPPVANAGGAYSGVIGQNVPFNGSGSFDADGTIASYSWSFGDGGTGSGVAPTHAFASVGTYTVTLTVTDNLGAQASANTSASISTAGSEPYLVNFNQSALARQPSPDESAYWLDILRAAHANGQNSKLLAMRELGKTLFESSEYAARNRDNHWYVYDLYRTYLMREPDAAGWAFWENSCNNYGREEVRRAFDECGEFVDIVATLTPNGSPSSTVSSFASARVDPFNQPGNGLASRDTEWSVPLLSLPGRAGLVLGLSLSYSSMIWTRSGPYVYFDEDNGWPSPGFRLGFPTIQEMVFDAQAGRNVYLLISGGGRVSLRQLGTSNVYEAADSSYLQLIDYGGSLLVRATDGTQLSYLKFNNEWRCTQIKDRNGNYITVNYDWLGHITTIIDTLARTITFNYDTNQNLNSITQSWTVNGVPTTHTWATFGWATKTLQPSFSGVIAVGAPNGSIPVLSQVGLHDGSRHTFEYNATGQVNPIRSYGSDNVERTYTAYDYDSPAEDCPRLSETHVWAQNWTGINGVPQEVATVYGDPGDGSHTVTAPDGTLYKEFYGAGWKRGLVTQTEVWSADGVKQKWTSNNWTQDNAGVNYQTNPRVTETNVHDPSNHRRTTIDYQTFTLPSGASCSLPGDTREYAGSASTALRHSHIAYRMDAVDDVAYLSRHIIGLVKEQTLFEVSTSGETPMSKVGFQYDEAESIQGADTPAQHDNSYDSSFVTGRGNLSSMKRYDVSVIDNSQFTLSRMEYNTAGGVVSSKDPRNHETKISYTDSFSVNGIDPDAPRSFTTLAFPTTVTDADNHSSLVRYNYDTGAKMRVQGPPPANQTQGLIQIFAYDAATRIERVTTTNNGTYQRFEYGPNFVETFATVNSVADEAYSNTVFDGAGRTVLAASNHPVSGHSDRYSARHTIYDLMGRAVKQSNPAETTGAWTPAGDDVAGWIYSEQSYDWQGRLRITTNTDGTTKEASYSGCGCAGGAVVTLTDEGTMDAGVLKRRQQKVYSDILGRTVKTELLNWEGGSAYSTTVNNYNARDQVTRVRQFDAAQGTVPSDPNDLSCPSGSCQETTMSYDGYGRLKTKHVPEQNAGTSTTWGYNDDDTVKKVTDARGSIANFTYNDRHLVTEITYDPSAGITDTPDISFEYDSAGNRTLMTDGLGSTTYGYDQLSRMTSEIRSINSIGAYSLNYAYNLANQLSGITDPFSAQVGYTHDTAGRLNGVTGSGYANVSTYASNLQYRAWGALKGLTYGNNLTFAASYNSRLQGTQFEVAGRPAQYGTSTVMKTQFDYYADGAMRYAHDLLDERFDRAFSYDHVAMVKEAYSGSESRDYVNGTNSGTQTGPYRQSYQRDPFGNLTQRDNRFWSQTDTLVTSHTNNRNQNTLFQYDPAGNLLQDGNLQYTYDAGGQNTTLVSPESNNRSITPLYDGDGQVGKRTERKGNTTTSVSYFVRSSVLGGNIITELDQNGQKFKGHVFAGGDLLATQQNDHVTWRHENPFTGSSGYSGIAGGYAPEAEPDPTGVNVGFGDPNICCLPVEPNDEAMPALLGSFVPGQCRVDGMAIDCVWAREMMAGGSAVQCPNNDCGSRTLRAYDSNGNFVGRVLSQPFQAFADGYSGFLPPGARYQGNGYWDLPGTGRPPRSGPPTLRTADPSRPRGSDDGINEGRSYRLGVTPQRLFNHSQNSSETPFDWALFMDLARVAAALQRESCRNLFGGDADVMGILGVLARGDTNFGSITRGDLGAPQGGSVRAAVTTGISGRKLFLPSRVGATLIPQSAWVGANITINNNAQAPGQSGYRDYLGVGASDDVYRAITLIHELGHVAALIYGVDASRILNDIDNPGLSRTNSQLVYDNCFR